MLEEVRDLFEQHEARATFFITGSHCSHTSGAHVEALLADGHELLNHNMMDRPYNRETAADFEADFLETEQVLEHYRNATPPWYRAPFGRLSRVMQAVLDNRGLTHVLCDCFANDTAIPDPEWIARFILGRVKPGSIVLIHMPERGCREWNLQAMRLTLQGLSQRGLRVVNFSELHQMKATA
jgi:peptidoglycan/xylan/chitin deacetylase (PgdA/CDA1 family)